MTATNFLPSPPSFSPVCTRSMSLPFSSQHNHLLAALGRDPTTRKTTTSPIRLNNMFKCWRTSSGSPVDEEQSPWRTWQPRVGLSIQLPPLSFCPFQMHNGTPAPYCPSCPVYNRWRGQGVGSEEEEMRPKGNFSFKYPSHLRVFLPKAYRPWD